MAAQSLQSREWDDVVPVSDWYTVKEVIDE
jgi:hypothetical protein